MTPYGLVPDLYEMEIRSGKKYRSKRFTFDYEKGRVWMEQSDKDGRPRSGSGNTPVVSRPLLRSALHLLQLPPRMAGRTSGGRETYRAAGIPLDQGEPIRIRLSRSQDAVGKEVPGALDATVFIENRMFIERKSRTLFVRFDASSMLPTEGRAPAVTLLGDVVGKLKDRNGTAWKTTSPSPPPLDSEGASESCTGGPNILRVAVTAGGTRGHPHPGPPPSRGGDCFLTGLLQTPGESAFPLHSLLPLAGRIKVGEKQAE